MDNTGVHDPAVALRGDYVACPMNDTEVISSDSGSEDGRNLIIPALGQRRNPNIVLPQFILAPNDSRYRYWKAFLAVLSGYSAWACLFEFGFHREPVKSYGFLTILDSIVIGFFLIDFGLTFFVAYLDKSTSVLVTDQRKIAWKYLKSWLVLDILSLYPAHIFAPNSSWVDLLILLRVFRLRRIGALFTRLEKDLRLNYSFVRCAWLLSVTLFAIHCGGCLYYSIGDRYHDPTKTWIADLDDRKSVRYITSLYWSMTTLTTVGYGDVHAVNVWEMLFTMAFMLFNMGLAAYLIGGLTLLFARADNKTQELKHHWGSYHFALRLFRGTISQRDKIKDATSFARRNEIPGPLRDQIISHLLLKYKIDSERLLQQNILDSLPKSTRSLLCRTLFYDRVITAAYLLQNVSSYVLFQLVSKMKPEYFPPGVEIMLQNEAPKYFYIIVTGKVDLLVAKTGEADEVVGRSKDGDLFGEIGVVCDRPQLFKVRTRRLTQLLRLKRSTFLTIIKPRNEDWETICHNLWEHLDKFKTPQMMNILQESKHILSTPPPT